MFLSSVGNGFRIVKGPKPEIYAVAPDLAVEILSKDNTAREMDRKLREYFEAGVGLVWYIEPKTRTGGSTHPSMSGRRSVPTIRFPAERFSPASNCRSPNCSRGWKNRWESAASAGNLRLHYSSSAGPHFCRTFRIARTSSGQAMVASQWTSAYRPPSSRLRNLPQETPSV